MAEKINGTVQAVRKNEQYGLYSVKVDGVWYGAGKQDPKVSEGDAVSGEFFTNDKGYKTLTKTGLTKGAKASPAQAPAGASAPASGGSNTMSKGEWAAKDDAIRYQSSRKDALAFLALPGVLDAVVSKAKPADKVGIIEALVDKYTASFFADVATFGAVARANGTEDDAKNAPPADDSDDE